MSRRYSVQSILLQIIFLVPFLNLANAYKSPFNTTLVNGADDYCRATPYYLSPATKDYRDLSFTLTCWTHSHENLTLIPSDPKYNNITNDDDRIWIKTTDNCYVAEFSLEYNGTAQEDLPYCGSASERKYEVFLMETKYVSACIDTPDLYVHYDIQDYKENTEIEAICWTGGDAELHDTTWIATTDGCFVHEQTLTELPDKSSMPQCYPRGYDPYGKRDVVPAPLPVLDTSLSRRNEQKANYLINVTISDDWAYCYSEPDSNNSTVITAYPYGESVIVQCLQWGRNVTYPLWGLTQDFCFVVETGFAEGFVEGEQDACVTFGHP
ncbi:hypothetical protein G7Y89_g5571 [Cudoniella acicularis]|uniref:Uncharacterized protein n=1 Tax=Cudoniella acicularis TaxID=354080 RepID=A0A8H4RM90_9HELO|nr:hypothetical protein G7Y89_g5571 [Cudoniella acicularis]